MKSVKLTSLVPGAIAETNFYSETGELLITKDVEITQRHLDTLKRRNIFDLNTGEQSEDEELHTILSSNFETLDKLDLDDKSKPPPSRRRRARPKATRARVLELPEFKEIRSGRDGLFQLARSAHAEALDRRIKAGRTPDTPSGPALSEGATEMAPVDRSTDYKNNVSNAYNEALAETRQLLQDLANCRRIDATSVRTIVERFVRAFVTDRNILLNLSSLPPVEENYVFTHSLNVCLLTINIAASAGYSKQQVIEIGMGALLHDVGMLLIPEDIYLKQGRLTKGEWYEIQKHPILGLHLLERMPRLPEAVPYVAYQTHERENGRGYPKSRTSRFIHRFAKIVQVADIYEALSSPRAYREGQLPYMAMENAIKMTRKGLIAGEFVKSMLEYSSLFPVGSLVELSNKSVGKVVKANNISFAKPVVAVLINAAGEQLPPQKTYQIDLAKNINVQIARALSARAMPHLKIMDGF